jgi:hypothetical protein
MVITPYKLSSHDTAYTKQKLEPVHYLNLYKYNTRENLYIIVEFDTPVQVLVLY